MAVLMRLPVGSRPETERVESHLKAISPRNSKKRERRSPAISTKVFVGNLSYSTTQETLATALAEVGEVRSVFIGTDRETGRSRGFAFVEFVSPESVANAIRRFDGQEIDGRKVRVNAAEERQPGGGAGGGGGGRPPASFLSSPRPPRPAPSIGMGGGGWEPSPDFIEALRRDDRANKGKGSRRNLRARKRSLNF